MEVIGIRDLNIENLKGTWKEVELEKIGFKNNRFKKDGFKLEICSSEIRLSKGNSKVADNSKPLTESTDIKYLEGLNFVQLSKSFIIKQVIDRNSLEISYLGKPYIFER